jgi:hypothetical protein
VSISNKDFDLAQKLIDSGQNFLLSKHDDTFYELTAV